MIDATTTPLTIASPGAQLEARWDEGETARAGVVLCHPHPQHGGTMTAPLIHRVTQRLIAGGFAVLRFNFRGVGGSTGVWGGGEDEVDDVAAAFATASRRFADRTYLAGWSFGAATALRWQARSGDVSPLAAIAPPVLSDLTPALPKADRLRDARRLFVLGDRDQFVEVSELDRYVKAIGGRLEVIAGSDHFFYFREERVGDLVAAFFAVPG